MKICSSLTELDQLPGIQESGQVRGAGRLLHIMRHQHDCVTGLQLQQELFDARGRNRIERRARLVHQQHLGLDRERAGHAQALLLAAREAGTRAAQAFLDLVPQGRLAQAPFDDPVALRTLEGDAVEHQARGHVVLDRHGRKGRRLLEHHPDPPPHLYRIDAGRVDILPVEHHFALDARAGHDFMHPVEASHQGRLAASRRSDDRRQHVGRKRQVDVVDGARAVRNKRSHDVRRASQPWRPSVRPARSHASSILRPTPVPARWS